MYKESCNRFIFILILCTGFFFLNYGVKSQSFAAPPTKPSTTAQTAANKPKADILPLVVQDLVLRSNQVWIAIKRNDKGNLRQEDYTRIFVKLSGSKTIGSTQWTLAQVDPTHTLMRPNSKIDFNTKMLLKRPERLTTAIVFGSLKNTKAELLTPASLATEAQTGQSPGGSNSSSVTKPTLPAQTSAAARPAGSGAPATPVPMSGPVSGVTSNFQKQGSVYTPFIPGGITFGAYGQRNTAGDSMYFILYFDRTIAEGDVTLKLRRVGSDTVHASHIYHYRPITGEWSITSNFAIPDHGLVAADDYFLEAVHAAGNTGLSPVFSISLRGSTGLISFLKPAGRAVFNPGMQMHVDFQFNRPAADGLVHLDMFALGSHRPVLSWTSPYHTPARGTPQPIYTRELRLPDDLPFSNNYFIQATHAEGSGRSENFVISPLITRGGREVVDDIAVTDIFPDSRSTVTKARIRVTGAHYPLWVVWRTTARWTPTSILLYPGDNEVTIDDPGFRGEDGTCSLDYVVQLDPDNLYAETDETNNNLEKTIFIWGRNGRLSVRDLGFANTKYISCDPDSNLAVIFVVQYCGTASFESDWVQSLRQSGRLNGENFDREVEYEIYVSDRCGPGNLGDRLDNTVQPGQCILIRVWRNALLRADGDLTLRLAEPVASWRGITSPITVHLKFGMRDVITGTCVYNP